MIDKAKARVDLGVVLVSRTLNADAERFRILRRFCAQALVRHAQGDWGDVCEQDRQTNEWALAHGARLVSVYKFPAQLPGADMQALASDRVWIITERDRSATTLLYPSDY